MSEIKYNIINEKNIDIILNSLTVSQIISYISNDIVNILIENKEKLKTHIIDENDPLYSNKIPKIKIEDYITRFFTYSKIEISTLILSYIYIKRFIIKENYIISFRNIFRLIMSCTILAIKFNENKIYKNTFYAKVGGFDVDDLKFNININYYLNIKKLNNLEYNIFFRLDFNLRVLDNEFYEIILKIYKDINDEGE